MTSPMIESYHTTMVASNKDYLLVETPIQSSNEKSLEVTPEEDEAWINKLRDLAGMTA